MRRAQRELRRGIADPEAFFSERGITLTCWRDGETWWAATSDRSRQYGRGTSEEEARVAAVRRWTTEQEAPDLQRRPGQPLP